MFTRLQRMWPCPPSEVYLIGFAIIGPTRDPRDTLPNASSANGYAHASVGPTITPRRPLHDARISLPDSKPANLHMCAPPPYKQP